jgi:hypothetical protein
MLARVSARMSVEAKDGREALEHSFQARGCEKWAPVYSMQLFVLRTGECLANRGRRPGRSLVDGLITGQVHCCLIVGKYRQNL